MRAHEVDLMTLIQGTKQFLVPLYQRPYSWGQPDVPIDLLAPGRQQHEEVVTQQVGLGELEAGVVQRLEDPVDVVTHLRSDLHQPKSPTHYLFNPGDVVGVVRVIEGDEIGLEPAVGVPDATGDLSAGRQPQDARPKIVPVGLRRQQPEPLITLSRLVSQVYEVDPAGRLWVGLPDVVADRREQHQQRRQPLLPVHHQPLRQTTASGMGVRARRQHHRTDEVPGPLLALPHPLRLGEDVRPELPELVVPRCSGPLGPSWSCWSGSTSCCAAMTR